jgi:hypothetical protein
LSPYEVDAVVGLVVLLACTGAFLGAMIAWIWSKKKERKYEADSDLQRPR